MITALCFMPFGQFIFRFVSLKIKVQYEIIRFRIHFFVITHVRGNETPFGI